MKSSRRTLLKSLAAVSAAQGTPMPAETDREYFLKLLGRLAEPVLTNLARGTLKRNMPVECVAGAEAERRR